MSERTASRIGSAPRARGTVTNRVGSGETTRLSPACAGNGPVQARNYRRNTAQPRVRGERGLIIDGQLNVVGSAPRARGTAQHDHQLGAVERLSPACAGNGVMQPRPAKVSPAQPRVRGERDHLQRRVTPENGSAPRARGTETPGQQAPSVCRLSPACAGNGGCCRSWRCRSPAQPRVRGERFLEDVVARDDDGSAPRARGTGCSPVMGGFPIRLSPACAGNGREGLWRRRAESAQPRVRGERRR